MSEQVNIDIEDLNKRQYEIFDEIISTPPSETKYHVIRASRQSGKSFLLLRLAIYFTFEGPKKEGAMVSASDKQFRKLWRDLIEITPEALIVDTNLGTNIIKFSNGSTIQFFTAKNYNAIVGNTFDWLICDEVAIYPNHALGFITPTLDAKKNSKAIFASTPRGKNEFYHYCMRGMDQSNSFIKHYKMSYLDNKNYDVRAVEEKRKTMVDMVFRSEYLAEFVFGASSVFGSFNKYQKIREWPKIIKDELYVGGIDVSGDGEDSTILTIMNSKGEVVYMYETEFNSIPAQAEELIPIIHKYNNAYTKVEKNGLGQGLLDIIQLKCNRVTGFNTTNESKNTLVTKFKISLHNNDISLPTVDLFPKLDNEMSSFIVDRTSTGKLTYQADKGFHDDTVMSLLICNYVREMYIGGNNVSTFNEDNINTINTKTPTTLDLINYKNDEEYEYI